MNKLIVFALIGILNVPSFTLAASPDRLTREEVRGNRGGESKLAPDLEEILTKDDEKSSNTGRTRETLRSRRETVSRAERSRINGVTIPSVDINPEEKQSFIVQFADNTPEIVKQEKLAQLGGRSTRRLERLGLSIVEVPRNMVRLLAADNDIAYISPDRPVSASGHVSDTTGSMNSGIVDKGDTDPNTWLDGGVGHIAVIDSGIDTNHSLMKWVSSSGTNKVVYQNDFTGQNILGDPYGHGTHVTTMFGGDYTLNNASYSGVAGGSNILSLRVLDSNGQGTTSNLIAALDWCVANKANWNIRVINMSLGTIAKDSYKNDPLCLAARRAWNAGIVVVCAAGNYGKDLNGRKVYGAIHSPGNDPSVITVGAANTFGTNTRSDDTVATFSSRGPTRSYATINGVRKYDNLIKPDLIAPGNKLIGARSSYNSTANKLISQYPTLGTGSTTISTDKLMYLSGTSMSAPIVSGAALLLIHTNPNLTPNMVKAILMYTAQPLAGFNMMEQGAGELNVDGAVRLARLIKPTLPTTNGTALLTAALPTQQSIIAGQTVKWGQGIVTNYGFLYGSSLMQYWQGVYAHGAVLADATTYSGTAFQLVTGKTYSATFKPGAFLVTTNGAILADAANTIFTSGAILADGAVLADGAILADGAVLADGQVLAEGTATANSVIKGSALLGDNTAGMQPAP